MLKYIILIILILIIFTFYACIVVGARADEQSQQLFQKWKDEKFEKE